MTQFFRDILRQPDEMQRAVQSLSDARPGTLEAASNAVRNAEQVYLTGIGSSWHAAMNVGALFQRRGRPVYLEGAAELLEFGTLPEHSVFVVLSRSGKSTEIVQLARKAC